MLTRDSAHHNLPPNARIWHTQDVFCAAAVDGEMVRTLGQCCRNDCTAGDQNIRLEADAGRFTFRLVEIGPRFSPLEANTVSARGLERAVADRKHAATRAWLL
jgi:hypothetical protein